MGENLGTLSDFMWLTGIARVRWCEVRHYYLLHWPLQWLEMDHCQPLFYHLSDKRVARIATASFSHKVRSHSSRALCAGQHEVLMVGLYTYDPAKVVSNSKSLYWYTTHRGGSEK